jgi:hypothetical protein
VSDVVAQIIDQIGIRIVRHNHFGGTTQRAYQAWEASTRTKLQDGLALHKLASTFF